MPNLPSIELLAPLEDVVRVARTLPVVAGVRGDNEPGALDNQGWLLDLAGGGRVYGGYDESERSTLLVIDDRMNPDPRIVEVLYQQLVDATTVGMWLQDRESGEAMAIRFSTPASPRWQREESPEALTALRRANPDALPWAPSLYELDFYAREGRTPPSD